MRQDKVAARIQLMNIDAREGDGVTGGQGQRVVSGRRCIDDVLQLLLAEAERTDIDQILPLMEIADRPICRTIGRLVGGVEVEREYVAAAEPCERIAGRAHDDVVAGGARDLSSTLRGQADIGGCRGSSVVGRKAELIIGGLTDG